MTDFFLTQMGRRFYESTMPELVKQLADLNANLRKQNKPDDNATANPLLCSKRGGCGFQSDCAKCRQLKEQRTRAEKQTRKFADSEGQAVKSEIAARASELSLKQELESVTKRLIELDDNFMKLHAQHRDTVEELEALRDRLEKGPPWLAEAAQALGAVQPNGEPLALNWTQVLAQIRHINAELNVERKHVDTLQQERDELWSENQRLKGIARGLDFERELRSRAEANLAIEKDAHQLTRQLHATALQRGVDLSDEITELRTQLREAAAGLTDVATRKLELVSQKLGISLVDTFEHFREQLNNALDDD